MMKSPKTLLFKIFFIVLCWYLFAFIVYPVYITIYHSFIVDNKFSLQLYNEFLKSKVGLEALKNSFILVLLTIPLCGFMGVSLALCIHAVKIPFRKFWHSLILLPMVIPGTVVVIAYINIYGNRGMIGWPLRTLLGLDFSAIPFEGLGAILFIHMFTQYIFFYLLTSEAIDRIDVSQIEAAQIMGASPKKIFSDVILPSLAPALSSSAILTGLGAFSSFSAPLLLGSGFRVITTEIYYNRQNGFNNTAIIQSVVLSIMILLILFIVRSIESRIFHGVNTKGSAKPFSPITTPWVQKVSLIYLSFITIFILLPIIAVIIISFGERGTWIGAFHSKYTLDNYKFVFENSRNFRPIINSIMTTSLATIGSLGIGVFIAYIVTRTKEKTRFVIESISMIPWLLPSSALLMSLIVAYNVPSFLIVNQVLVGTYWFMPLAYMLMRLPLMVRNTSASLITLPTSLEEASRSLGATGFVTFRRIILPFLKKTLLFSATITFIFLIGDYNVPIFVSTPSNTPIILAMLGNMGSQRTEVAMVYGVLLIIIALGVINLLTIKDNHKKYSKDR